MTQDELKQAVAQAALDYILPHLESDTILGIGTGSTARLFIDLLGQHSGKFDGAVSSSEASTEQLKSHGIPVYDLNSIDSMPFYIDGADEANAQLHLIKGGGAALTREKIVTACADKFICIADASKDVEVLGKFPLPVEVIPMARAHVAREIVKLGGNPVHRADCTTDNGCQILDVYDLAIHNAPELEATLNNIPGVVTNGLFALRPADVLLIGTANGVETRFAAKP